MLPERSDAIEWISPTRLERLRCPARIAFEQGGGNRRSPSSTAALLGTTVHRALELVCLGTEIEQAWTAACSETAAAEGVDPARLPGFRRLHLRYRRRANELVDHLARHPHLEPLPEQDLTSADGVLRGQADLVLLAPDHLVVIDHKAGLVSDEDRLKEAYVRQVQIYAALASAHYHRPAASAALLSLREGMVDIDVSAQALDTAVDEARRQLAEFNRRAPGPQPPNPTTATCRWCPYSARCDGFWTEIDDSWPEVVGVCVRGHVKRAEVAQNRSGSLELEVTEGHPPEWETVIISGVPGHHLATLDPGAPVSLTGLRRHFRIDSVLEWRPGSQIWITAQDQIA